MRRMFVWLFVTLLCMQVSSVFAQDAKILEKSHKDLMKSLKKQYGYKDVSVKVEEDGVWYFLLTKKDGGQLYYGVADQSGKVIIPTYHDQIFYFPAMEAGTGKIPCYNEAGNFVEYMDIHYDKSDAVFLAKHDKASLFSSDGKLLRNFDSSLISYLPGYFVVGIEESLRGHASTYETATIKFLIISTYSTYKGCSLYTYNGNELVSSAYAINFGNNGSCIYEKYIDNINQKGGFLQKDHSQQIPCLFNRISYNEKLNKWTVQRNSQSKEETFIPTKSYQTNYRDKGEEYFEKRQYDNVIEFYANEGINAPWAKFFTANALYHKAFSSHLDVAENLSKAIEENNSFNMKIWGQTKFDLGLAKQQLLSSIDIMNAYLNEDSIYTEEGERIKEWATDAIQKIPTLKQRYEKALALLKQRKEEQRLAEIKRQQEAQQRETEIMMGFLKIFANALAGNSGSSNSSSYSSGGGTYNSTTTSSSSSSRGINKSKLADWQSRKANAERLLEDYREQLRKNPNDAALKSKIRSQEGVLRTCNEQISLIESGQIY